MKILVADNDKTVGVLTARYIEEESAKFSKEPLVATAVFTLNDAINAVGTEEITAVLLDLNWNITKGAETLIAFRNGNQRCKAIPVAIFTGLGPNDKAFVPTLRQCCKKGDEKDGRYTNAQGFFLKEADPDQMLNGLARLLAGERPLPEGALEALLDAPDDGGTKVDALSGPEQKVADLLIKGFRNQEIADLIGRKEGTVRQIVHSIFVKLGVETRTEAVVEILERKNNAM